MNLYITSWFSLKNTSTDSRNRASVVIYEGCSFQSTAVQTYLDHVNDSHYSIELPVRFKPTDDDLLQETSTRGVFPLSCGASSELDTQNYEDTTLILPELTYYIRTILIANLIQNERFVYPS